MKITSSSFLTAAGCALLFTASAVRAEAPKEYQVTGPVTALTDGMITVQKGKELWEVSRGPAAAVTGGELKVGDKVTVHYSMVATAIEDKGAAPAGKADKPAKAAKKDKPAAAAPAAAEPAKQ